MIEIDTLTLSLLTGTVVPLLVAVVTKARASSTVKGVANLVLSFAAGALAFMASADGAVAWQEVVGGGLSAWLTSGVAFHNLWKPLGTAQAVATSTGSFGIGVEQAPPYDPSVYRPPIEESPPLH